MVKITIPVARPASQIATTAVPVAHPCVQTAEQHSTKKAPVPSKGKKSGSGSGSGSPRRRPASGFYGVKADGKRWAARSWHGGKEHYLGFFDTKEEAAHAYDQAQRAHRSKSCLLNFPSVEVGANAAKQAAETHAKKGVKRVSRGPFIHGEKGKRVSREGLYGVSKSGDRWIARLAYGGKQHYIGTYTTKEEAAHARDDMARIHRKDAPLNYASTEAGAKAAAEARARQGVPPSKQERTKRRRVEPPVVDL